MMRITEVSPSEYKKQFAVVPHVFNSVEFSELNRDKVDGLHYLMLADDKVRFGIILGEKSDGLHSPFSAPFGGFVMPRSQRLRYMEEALELVQSFRPDANIHVTLPPLIYDQSQLSKWVNVLQRRAAVTCIDLNYHFDLSRFPRYEEIVGRDARWGLHRAAREGLEFVVLAGTDADIERAYSVIEANRAEHGYPLRMTLQAVKDTVRHVKADFFVMTHGGIDIAAAQVFHVADGVAQVIYWGDLKEYARLRTMNWLAYNVFQYYYKQGLKILDIGPSTEDGVPNHGLCEFKESIGCDVSPKFRFLL